MAIRANHQRLAPPLALAAALALAGASHGRGVPAALVSPARVDPGRDPGWILRSLEGIGEDGARRIAAARRFVRIDSPAALLAVPGVGPRGVHRWHAELSFPRKHP
jgi:hypothetical protein